MKMNLITDFLHIQMRKKGHWVGFAYKKGDHPTWKILTDETNQIITRSAVRSATKTSSNLRLDPSQGEDQPLIQEKTN